MKIWLSLLGICVLLGGLLSGTHVLTQPHIQANRTAAQRAVLTALVAPQKLPAALNWQQRYLSICQQLTLESVVAQGYGGPMTLFITYQRQACAAEEIDCSTPQLRNIVVSKHAETPGIGDFFATTHPNWLSQLTQQLSDPLSEPPVDTISGATITVTALSGAVAAALNVGTAIPFAGGACEPAMATQPGNKLPLLSAINSGVGRND